jgi:hypothetical protein
MMMRRGFRRGPGLVRTAARTAVVAGTATAVVGGVSRHQANKAAAKDQAAQADQVAYENQQQIADLQQQVAAQQAAQQVPAAAAAAAGGDDVVAKLQELAQLHSSGVLSDEEFATAKAKLLG